MRKMEFVYILKHNTDNVFIRSADYTMEQIEESADIHSDVYEKLESCDGNSSCVSNGFCECGGDIIENFEIIDRVQFTGDSDCKYSRIYEKDYVLLKNTGGYDGVHLVTWKDGAFRSDSFGCVIGDFGQDQLERICSFYDVKERPEPPRMAAQRE